ncbi:hypothetical protein BSL82_10030 [Tardibacter chloracetimidivorans]|uniref:Uncharacterized protein n=1 Tax=Tardibacter chloracetimidivorans TaxID=1921510 RepID=A0A1L3ZVF2_9SPHN|nr:hypothetical protein [Tardibacter chloracetimidivorans]API59611.1 hypothetical protein BSL82_10030 [Tardibacter chloracetimidivorans]
MYLPAYLMAVYGVAYAGLFGAFIWRHQTAKRHVADLEKLNGTLDAVARCWRAQARKLSTQRDSALDAVEELKHLNSRQRVELDSLRTSAHRRDPKTGRILPRGA